MKSGFERRVFATDDALAQSPENNEEKAKKIGGRILNKFHEDPMFFVFSEGREQFEEALVTEFGEYDPKIVASYFESQKAQVDQIADPATREFFSKLNDWNAVGHNEAQCVESFINLFEPASIRLKKLCEQVASANSIEDKRSTAQLLRSALEELLAKRQYVFERSGRHVRDDERTGVLTLRDLFDHDYLHVSISGFGSTSGAFSQERDVLKKVESEVQTFDRLGNFDSEGFEKDRLRFGAKAAFLPILEKLAEDSSFFEMQVPPFERVPAKVYSRWKQGGKIAPDLQPLYHSFIQRKLRGKRVIVRSSAVHSEDNEHMTGAGVYTSIPLPENPSFRDFFKAVLEVYKSTDSDTARKYREENGVTEEEQMGLIVQEYIESNDDTKGYVNSVLHNVPELMDVVYDSGLRPVIVREQLAESLDLGERRNIFHYQFDLSRKYTHVIENAASLALRLERYFGAPVQIEFIETDRTHEEDGRYGTFVLQVRFLPKDFGARHDITFPEDMKPIYEGRGMGAIDSELEVLDNGADNGEKKGAVIFKQSKFTSTGEFYNRIQRALPKEGAVIILGGSRSEGGHIETICAEKGIAVIFSDDLDHGMADRMLAFGIMTERFEVARIRDLDGHKKLRVVSNGLDGKVYGLDVVVKESGESA